MEIDAGFVSSRHVASWVTVDRRYRTSTVVGGGLGLMGLRHVPIEGREVIRDRMWRNLQGAMEASGSRFCVVMWVLGNPGLAEWLHHLGREVGAVESFVSVGAEFGVAGGLWAW
ncbi:MAG: hypothetical protein R3E66_22300 [bacterium]